MTTTTTTAAAATDAEAPAPASASGGVSSSPEGAAVAATAAPSALEALLSCDYPDVDALATARAGAGVGTYADELGELADMAAAVQRRADEEEGVLVPVSAGPKWEVLIREVGHMLADARKREFHPCLEAMRGEGARLVAEAAQLRADLTWVPLNLPLELVAVVRDGWDRCCDLRTEHEEAEAVRADAWEGLAPLLRSPVPATIDAAQPLIESDSTEETRRGWNLEWTWKRRAQFNWAVETLLEGLQRRAEYHAELGDRLAALTEHMGLVNTVADRCRDASNAFCLLGAGRPAREYQALVAPLLAKKEAVLNGTREDVAAMQEEREVIFKQDLQHRAYFERIEAAGGLDTIDLRAELEGLHRRIDELGAQKADAVAKVSEERRALEETRQAEIDRALRESKEFLDDNTRRQEACAEQVRAIEEQHERDVEEVRRCIEANRGKGEEALRRHAAEAAARRERESTRGLAMARLRDDAERLLTSLREKVAAAETEVAYVREAVTPLCHRLALGTTTHQREHLLELYAASEHPPEQLAKCLAPAFTYRALLCSSLVRCCDDIDNVVDSSRTHLAFCKETDDPKGLMMADVMRDLAEQKQAMLLQATETRLNMATDIQCWQKIGRVAGELWEEAARVMYPEHLHDVRYLLDPSGSGATLSVPAATTEAAAEAGGSGGAASIRSADWGVGTESNPVASDLTGVGRHALRSPPKRQKEPFPAGGCGGVGVSGKATKGFHKLPALSPREVGKSPAASPMRGLPPLR